MIQYPVLKAKYHVEILPDRGIFLLSENEKHVLEGESMFRIVPLLDGRRTWQDIVSLLEPVQGRDETLASFEILRRCNHVEEAVAPHLQPYQIYWTELGLNATKTTTLVSSHPLHVIGLGADINSVVSGLRSFGFAVNATPTGALLIVVADDYQNRALEAINLQSLSLGRPWILLKPYGLVPMVGPFFRPGRTACWKCLDSRLHQNREAETYIRQCTGRAAHFPLIRRRCRSAKPKPRPLRYCR